jgi:hypothetical protein
MAVLVFNGSAVIDGQEVDGEPKPAPAEPVWHRVNSAMAIDRLPEDACYVEASGLKGEYLTLILERPGLKGVRFTWGQELQNGHLRAVKGQPELEVIDLSRAAWLGVPDYTALVALPKLKRATLHLVEPRQETEKALETQLAPVKALVARGVDVDFGPISRTDGLLLRKLADEVKSVKRLTLDYPEDDMVKVLGDFPALSELILRTDHASELAFVHLARATQLTHLQVYVTNGMREEYVHQIRKMETLRSLVLGHSENRAAPILDVVKEIKQLDELELLGGDYWVYMRSEEFAESNAWIRATPFKRLTLNVFYSRDAALQPIHVPRIIPTKLLELKAEEWRQLANEASAPPTAKLEDAKALTTLRCLVRRIRDKEDVSEFVAAVKVLPSLQTIEIAPWGEPSDRWNAGTLASTLEKELPEIKIVVLH